MKGHQEARVSAATAISIHQTLSKALDDHKNGNTAAGRAACAQLIAVVPDHAEAHYVAGLLAREDKDIQGAKAYFQRARQLEPTASEFADALGVTEAMSGHAEEALVLFNEAIRLDPEAFDPHYNLATVLLNSQQPRKAADAFVEALRINNKSTSAWVNTALTPGNAWALEVSIRRIIAWAWGLRSTWP